MNKLFKLLRSLDDNFINILLIGFIFFVPLFPKLPFHVVYNTYIAIRWDDFYIVLLVLAFLIQLWRKKVVLRTQFLKYIVIFWVAVFLSFLWGHFIGKTILFTQLGFLTAARRVQYMIIFPIVLSVVTTQKRFRTYLYLIAITLFLVCIYGVGQKVLGWPAIQTMNPAYSRGSLLFLTPEARISSTFGGHYDLAAYLVLLIPIMLGLFFSYKRLYLYLISAIGIFVLVLTASRISFGAFIVSAFAFLVFIKKPKYLITTLIITTVLTMTSQNLLSRIGKTVQLKQIFVNERTGQVVVPERITSKELPAGSFYISLNDKTSPVSASTEALLRARILHDLRDQASKAGKILTSGQEEAAVSTISGQLTPVNTVISDISFATRLQVEWPRAINAFLHNPILGGGASSITESTDNDYLRWIGEFGLLGTLSFFYLLYKIARFIFEKVIKIKDDQKYLYWGFLFGLGGLLMNAGYIDVFEASKVAYYFWFIAGLFVASLI